MTHVVINNITPQTSYSPTTGTSYTIPSTWGFFATSDIVVYSGTTQLSYAATPTSSTNFATSGTAVDGGYQGGNVVLGAASTANTITLRLEIPVERATDFPYPAATINIEDLNTDIDKAFGLMQQFVRDLARTPGQLDSDTGTIGNLGSHSDRASMILGFNATGGTTFYAANAVAAASLPITVANGGTSATTTSGARTNLGLAIGSDVQAYNADITDLAASRLIGRGSASSGVAEDLTVGASLSFSGTTLSLASPVTLANGGTSATTAAGARTNLGLAIGTDVQAYNADITDLAASRLIGRGSASSGVAEDLTLGSGLSMSGTTLTATGSTATYPLVVPNGGTGSTAFTAYAVICGGTASTGVLQSITSVGTSGQVLTSNGSSTLPTFQAAAGGGLSAGDQALMEAATSSTGATTPGIQHFHPGHPKVWANVITTAGTPSLTTSYNVTSIADTGTGSVTITIATDFSSTTYASVASPQGASGASVNCWSTSKAAGTVIVNTSDTVTQALADATGFDCAMYGDQT